jgi:hypothetical protein
MSPICEDAMNQRQEPHFEWKQLEFSADFVVKIYVDLAKRIPGVLRIWARVTGNRVHFTTQIEDKRTVERALYDVELQVMDKVGPYSVYFDVIRDDQAVYQPSEESSLVLQLV